MTAFTAVKITRKNLYWALQIAGWSLYGILSAMIFSLSERTLTFDIAYSLLLSCTTGLLLSHLYREVIHAYRWVHVAVMRLVVQVFIACIILGASFFGISLQIVRLFPSPESPPLSPMYVVASIINAAIIYLLWSLMYFSFHFFQDYRKREIEHLKWEGAIKDFELNKLKSQLNPHFVFNALNSIRSLVDEDPAKAKISITQLSNILRNSLIADRNKTISFSEELRTVNDYLNLEKLRYEERLNVRMKISPEVLNVPVPPMMVQTIVENAVKHGISKQVSAGFIELEAHLDEQQIAINIRNSGKLTTTDALSPNTSGFGLINTRQRLELLYGAKHSFGITQADENTVNVHLTFPII